MTGLIACPHCAKHLMPPSESLAGAQLECPHCQQAFLPDSASAPEVLQARVVPPEPPQVQPAKPGGLDLDDTVELAPPPMPKREQSPAASSQGTPPSTLSDWLNQGPPQPQPEPEPEPAPPQPTGPASNPEELFDPHRTVEGFEPQPPTPPEDDADRPSLESLLSSFRGEAADKPAAAPTDDATPGDQKQDDPEATLPFSSSDTISASSFKLDLNDRHETEENTDPTPEQAAEALSTKPTAWSEPMAKDFEVDLEQTTAELSEEREEYESDGRATIAKAPALVPRSRQKRRSKYFQTTAVLLGGVLGIGLGYLGLQWATGSQGDPQGVAAHDPPSETPEGEGTTDPPTIVDHAVAPASFNESPIEKFSLLDDSRNPPVSTGNTASKHKAPVAANPTGAASYTMADLQAALTGGEQARTTLSKLGLQKDPGSGRQLGLAYAKLSELAGVLALVEQPSNLSDLTYLEAKELYLRLFEYKHARSDSLMMAQRWMALPQRDQHGVFFAAPVAESARKGTVYEHRVKLSSKQSLTVLTRQPVDAIHFHTGMPFCFIGWVVDNPSGQVEGYTGAAKQAVWAGHMLSLQDSRFD